jgi:hypothetical protein
MALAARSGHELPDGSPATGLGVFGGWLLWRLALVAFWRLRRLTPAALSACAASAQPLGLAPTALAAIDHGSLF